MQNSVLKQLFTASALIVAATSHGDSRAEESHLLTPSTPWRLDYAERECRLLRTFGKDKEAITLRLARAAGLNSFDMVIAGDEIPRLGDHVKVTMKLEPQGNEQVFEGYSMGLPHRSENLIRWYDGDPEILNHVAESQRVRVLANDRVNIVMLWSIVGPALKALQDCHEDLLASWGADVKTIRAAKVQPQPAGNPGLWATNDDYPSNEMYNRIGGDVVFGLTISREGLVEDCRILLSSDSTALDAQTCKIMRKRAKFEPARDASDRPIAGYYISRMRWQIP